MFLSFHTQLPAEKWLSSASASSAFLRVHEVPCVRPCPDPSPSLAGTCTDTFRRATADKESKHTGMHEREFQGPLRKERTGGGAPSDLLLLVGEFGDPQPGDGRLVLASLFAFAVLVVEGVEGRVRRRDREHALLELVQLCQLVFAQARPWVEHRFAVLPAAVVATAAAAGGAAAPALALAPASAVPVLPTTDVGVSVLHLSCRTYVVQLVRYLHDGVALCPEERPVACHF